MFLYCHRGQSPNFGDELNHFIWPTVLKDFFDEDRSELFLGIGSILFDYLPRQSKKYVMGAGYGRYTAPPRLNEPNWHVQFVRGPLTAQSLGLDASLAIADPGILVRHVLRDARREPQCVSFMPHWTSMTRGNWAEVCSCLGIELIDPRIAVGLVLGKILRSRVVLAEAMHGAIVADALRVPWIPVLPFDPANRFKWFDWGKSLGIEFRPELLAPSNLAELKFARWSTSRIVGKAVSMLDESPLGTLANRVQLEACILSLQRVLKLEPILSADGAIERTTDAILSAVESFKRRA
jgi:succinoglycan biosynthesis protein ExoV